MNDLGVQTTVTVDSRTLKALLMLIQRVPMTELEAVAIEDLFGGWFNELQQQAASAREGLLETTADQPPIGAGAAAGDVLSDPSNAAETKSPLDLASGPLLDQPS